MLTPSQALGFYFKHFDAFEAVYHLSDSPTEKEIDRELGSELASIYRAQQTLVERVIDMAKRDASELCRAVEASLLARLQNMPRLSVETRASRDPWIAYRRITLKRLRQKPSFLEIGFRLGFFEPGWDAYVWRKGGRTEERRMAEALRRAGLTKAISAARLGDQWHSGGVRLISERLEMEESDPLLDREQVAKRFDALFDQLHEDVLVELLRGEVEDV